MSDSANQGRPVRFVVSVGLIVGALVLVRYAAIEEGVSPASALAGPIGYVFFAAVLILAIASRLYAQHEVRKLKLDLLVIILVTCLVALPFALSNMLWGAFEPQLEPQLRKNRVVVTLILSGVAIFFWFPIMFVTEALVVWARLFWFGVRESNVDAE